MFHARTFARPFIAIFVAISILTMASCGGGDDGPQIQSEQVNVKGEQSRASRKETCRTSLASHMRHLLWARCAGSRRSQLLRGPGSNQRATIRQAARKT